MMIQENDNFTEPFITYYYCSSSATTTPEILILIPSWWYYYSWFQYACRWIRDMRQCFCPSMAIWCRFIFWQSRMPPIIRMAITLMSGSISILDRHVNLGNVSRIASLWRSCPFALLTQDMLPRSAFFSLFTYFRNLPEILTKRFQWRFHIQSSVWMMPITNLYPHQGSLQLDFHRDWQD